MQFRFLLVALAICQATRASQHKSPEFINNPNAGSPVSPSASLDEDPNDNAEVSTFEPALVGNNDGRVRVSSFTFPGKLATFSFTDQKMGTSDDETLVLLTDSGGAFLTRDQGNQWAELSPGTKFDTIQTNPDDPDRVYLVCSDQLVVYSVDNGVTWKQFVTPSAPSPASPKPLSFHPTNRRFLLWLGQECTGTISKKCTGAVFFSRNYGNTWQKIGNDLVKCEFVGGLNQDPNLMICLDNDLEILTSNDMLQSSTVHLENVLDFVQKDGFIVAAATVGKKDLRLHTSKDGVNWVEALFPADFTPDTQQSFTILTGASGSLFVHVTTNPRKGSEFGTLLKSNGEGQSYVLSLDFVNRDTKGYVDYERVTGLEGVIVANVVSNSKSSWTGKTKTLKTVISHNDGARWSYLTPPLNDAQGKSYECAGKELEECSLHLHGYTERNDWRDTYGSRSAVGFMLGVGVVGDSLPSGPEGDTFLTADGGVTWKEIKKGRYTWEYGDQGSIIVLVDDTKKTNMISYSLDQGNTWIDFQFIDSPVEVQDLATVPSDNSVKFSIFTKDKKTRHIQLDFSQLFPSVCKLDMDHPDDDDFELWTPRHPFQENNCLFGHQAQYVRKIPGRLCRVGKAPTQPFKVLKNCSCTNDDFECGFNYYRDENAACVPVDGYTSPEFKDVCEVDDPPALFYPETGYRKVGLSTCQGGVNLERAGDPIPCNPTKQPVDNTPEKSPEGKPDDSNNGTKKKKGKSHGGTFFKVVLGLSAVGGLGYYLYRLYLSRTDGEISLSDDGTFAFLEDQGDTIHNLRSKVATAAKDAYVGIVSVSRGFMEKVIDAWDKYSGRNRFRASPYDELGTLDESDLETDTYRDEPDDDTDPTQV